MDTIDRICKTKKECAPGWLIGDMVRLLEKLSWRWRGSTSR